MNGESALKIFHTADLHLGMTFGSRGYPDQVRKALVSARWQVLSDMADEANKRGCRLFVIAGDLFNGKNVPKAGILEAAEVLKSFEGDCIAVLPGNHDYYDEVGGLWETFKKNVPDNVLLLSEPKPYDLSEYGLDLVLYPAPCDRKHSSENRIGWVREFSGSEFKTGWRIGIAHGSVEGISPDFDGRYFPMRTDELSECGLDVWLLGHTHVQYPNVESTEHPPFLYCGTPEPDGFDCLSGGRAWIVTLDTEKQRVKCDSVYTGRHEYKEIFKTVSCLEELEEAVREAAEGDADRKLVKFKVSGMLPEDDYRARMTVYDDFKKKVMYVEVDEEDLEMEITSETIYEEFTEGSFPSRLLHRLSEKGDKEALQAAYQMIRKVSGR